MERLTPTDDEIDGTGLAFSLLTMEMLCRLKERGVLPEEDTNRLINKTAYAASVALVEVEQEGISATGDDVDRFHRLEGMMGILRQGMGELLELEEKGTFTEQDVNDVIVSAILNLEQPEFVTRNVAHQARGILSYFADERGIKAKKPH